MRIWTVWQSCEDLGEDPEMSVDWFQGFQATFVNSLIGYMKYRSGLDLLAHAQPRTVSIV